MTTYRQKLDINVDGDRLHQVLDNLIGNAVKYANEGTIAVSIGPGILHGNAAAVDISVVDGGPGIHANDRDAVFTPFYRTRVASRSAVPGLGLGLYISSELIHEHDGTIAISETSTGGSRFTVSLPVPGRLGNT